MAVSVDGVVGDGTILMDTGINYMFLSPPGGTPLEPGTRAPAGTRIAVYLPDRRNPQPAFYAFTVGERGNPLRPEKVEVVRDRGVFVNTGRMFLEGFDYLYDAAGGYVGYGWNGRLSGSQGGVTPGLFGATLIRRLFGGSDAGGGDARLWNAPSKTPAQSWEGRQR